MLLLCLVGMFVNQLSRRFKNTPFSSKAIQNPSKICGKSLKIFNPRPCYLLSLFARLVVPTRLLYLLFNPPPPWVS